MRKLAVSLAFLLLLPALALAEEGQGVIEIPSIVNHTTFTGGEDYASNHLYLAFVRPDALTQPVDLYISLTQPSAEGGSVTYYLLQNDSRVVLANGIYFNQATLIPMGFDDVFLVPYCTNCTMPDTLQLYGPPRTNPILNDGWVVPAPVLCRDLPDGDYTITVEAYEPGTGNLLAKGEATITLDRGCPVEDWGGGY